jgi:hypothetical protein
VAISGGNGPMKNLLDVPGIERTLRAGQASSIYWQTGHIAIELRLSRRVVR